MQTVPAEPVRASIDSLTQDGRGVAHVEGKAVFVAGALPGEVVQFEYVKRRRHFDEAAVVSVEIPSSARVEPRCSHFGVCGGCSLQHMDAAAQVEAKEQVLLEQLRRIGRVEPETVLAPVTGEAWGYRRKARLGAKFVEKKGGVLVGFRERQGRYLAELDHCDVLHPAIGRRITALRQLIGSLDAHRQIPQIEIAVGDDVAALVFRHLVPLSEDDLARLRGFAQESGLQVWLQAGGPETAQPLWPSGARLSYTLPAYELEFDFRPTDFTQINAEVNRRMVDQALAQLDPQPADRVLDLFCGLGNLSLPLARRAGEVIGVEGDAELVQRAGENAVRNGLDNVSFYRADLNEGLAELPRAQGRFDKIMLDPPRTGAEVLASSLAELRPHRIVYISCNPATLARDAIAIVGSGYALDAAGVLDMFPHTNHVEAMAVFERAA